MCVEHTCNFSMGNEFKVTLGYTARLYFKRKKGRSHVERKADFFCMPLKLLKLFNSNAVTAVLEKVQHYSSVALPSVYHPWREWQYSHVYQLGCKSFLYEKLEGCSSDSAQLPLPITWPSRDLEGHRTVQKIPFRKARTTFRFSSQRKLILMHFLIQHKVV